MYTASLDLCKELYKLSGWFQHHVDPNTGEITNVKEVIQPGTGGHPLPTYDLGYLLRELPDSIEGNDEYRYSFELLNNGSNQNKWDASYSFYDDDKFFEVGDTPENAVAKLAIELFKQGILAKTEKE